MRWDIAPLAQMRGAGDHSARQGLFDDVCEGQETKRLAILCGPGIDEDLFAESSYLPVSP
jgi:hypothetical protein